MEPGLLATAGEFISGYWPHVSGGAVAVSATVGTAIFAYIRRSKSSPTEADPYFTETARLSPPLTRPAYSDRMAYRSRGDCPTSSTTSSRASANSSTMR